MEIEQVTRQIGSVHLDEIHGPCKFTYAKDGKLGYGETAFDAVKDAGCSDVEEQSEFRFVSPKFANVAQCWGSNGEENGILFKF